MTETNPHGSFLWYELMTTDPEAAAAFYRDLVGWTVHDFAGGEVDYRLFARGETDVAGLMRLPEGVAATGTGPGWLGYLAVDDVDEAARRVAAAGGVVHAPPRDIPGVGRFAFVADPQGAPYYVMRGSQQGESRSFRPGAVGHVSWNELATSDPDGAAAFYGELYGWQEGDTMPMGEMGVYQMLTLGDGPFGAVMRTPGDDPPRWTYYFQVDDVDDALARARRHPVTIQHGPAEVPGGDFILIGTDPQGATFAVVGPRTHEES